jgi:hypothetical protein
MTHRLGTDGIGAGAPGSDIEITRDMIQAGERIFYDRMIESDYLDGAPADGVVKSLVSEIFRSMAERMPCSRRKVTNSL